MAMQRGIASILVMLFGWLLVLPALASSTNSVIPACCRKNGKHHCTAMHPGQETDSDPGLNSVSAKCPCCPQSTVASAGHVFAPATTEAIFAGLVGHPAVAPQTAANFRISQDRSRQKRAPPSLILS